MGTVFEKDTIIRNSMIPAFTNSKIQKFKELKGRHPATFLYLIACWAALATVFAVRPELGNGVVSGKYFRFYLSMGLIAVISVVYGLVCRPAVRFGRADGLILLYGACTLSVSYFVHSSEAVTKQILLVLIILLYFYFRMFLSAAKSHGYRLVLFFLATGLAESFWGLQQLYGFEYSHHARFKLTGTFFNPGPYACYLAVVLPAAFGYLLRDRNCTKVKFRLRYWPLYLRWGVALLTCTGIVLVLPATMSRSAWLAAAGSYFIQKFEIGSPVNFHLFKRRCLPVFWPY
jgi:hypothetical protein